MHEVAADIGALRKVFNIFFTFHDASTNLAVTGS